MDPTRSRSTASSPDREPGVIEQVQGDVVPPVDLDPGRKIVRFELVQRDGNLAGANHPGPAGGGWGFTNKGLPETTPAVRGTGIARSAAMITSAAVTALREDMDDRTTPDSSGCGLDDRS